MRPESASFSYEELADELADSRDDLLLAAAALQLTPENQTKWARFVRLVELAHVIGPSSGIANLSAGWLQRLLTSGPIANADQTSSEDPSEEPFVSSIQFFGGNFRVLSGGATGAHVGCQLVLEATRLLYARGHDDFATVVFLEAQVLLALSEEMCRRAGLQRATAPADPLRSRLLLPDRKRLDGLKAAVTFTPEECRRIVGAELSEVIDSLTLHMAVAPPDEERDSPVDDRLYGLPLGQTKGGNIVLAVPGGVTMSVVHRSLVRALGEGLGAEFLDCLRRAQMNDFDQAAESMKWNRVGAPDGLGLPTHFSESFYSFDVDKLAHVCSVIDTLDGYEAGSPFEQASMQVIADELSARMPAVRSAFRVHPDRGSVLHLVVLAPLGRALAMGFDEAALDGGSELLVATFGDVVTMAGEVGADPLGIWAFVQARSKLHDRAHVLSFSALDEFVIYKGHSDGFYLGDERYPTMLSVQSDTAAPLRIESAKRRDVHAAVLPDSHGVALVERWPASNEQTIYRPVRKKFHAFHLVEIGLPVWVVPLELDGSHREPAEDMAEVVAFWLWRCRDDLAHVLQSLAEREIEPVVHVSVASPDPTASSDLEPVGDWLEVAVGSSGRIFCRLGEGAGCRFQGAGNAAERLVAREVVVGFYRLAGLSDPSEESLPEVLRTDSLVKMQHVLGSDADPVLTVGLGALPRLLQSSAVQVVLDQVGEQLEVAGLAVGPVDPADRTAVLNDSVAWAFGELWSLLQSLDPRGLLKVLAHETESIIYAESRANLQVPSQAACFGPESAAVERSRTYMTGMTATAIANRFVIELVTASPPSGHEQFSLGSYDRLIALASRIVEFGFVSDAIRYGLSDEHLGLLPSGRLGFDRVDAYQVAYSKFSQIVGGRAMTNAESAYPSHWKQRSPSTYDPRDIDAAYKAEFGISASDLGIVIGDLVKYARDAEYSVATRDLAVLELDLAASTGLAKAAVAAALHLLSLTPVAGFDPKRVPVDSYPWKFSRNRSMIRRPLLVRPTAAGSEVVWGARATWRAGRYLMQQLMSARYPARSEAMQKFIGGVTQQAGEEFNASVAEVLRGIGFDDVRERVQNIGKVKLLRPNGQQMGDVDVLVIDRQRRILLAVEAKDFELARTPRELANEVEKLIGEHGSASTHHRERLEFLRSHLPRVLNELGIADDSARWDVQGMVVTSADLLGTHYLAARGSARDLRLVSLDGLRERSPSQIVASSHRRNPAKAEKRQRKKRRKRR